VGERIKEIDEAAAKADRALALTAAKAKAVNLVILTLAPETAAKQIAAAAKVLPKGTALWLVYTKGTKPNGDTIIALARKAGLKDTKVARVSVTHAALRFIAA
jgi:phosphoglycolate phosphatase-like HAD superfamily hydrolase